MDIRAVCRYALKVAGCDLFSAGQIYDDDQTKAIFNSLWNVNVPSIKKY